MKKHVSHFFIPIYENHLSKINTPQPSNERDKLVDAIFHERGFIDWLRKKYKKKLSAKSYPILTTPDNFKKYIVYYNKIKNKTGESDKKNEITEQIQSENLKPINKHEYDIDIVETYFKIKQLLESVQDDKKFKNIEEYLDTMKYPILIYCKENDLPFKTVLQLKYPIVIPNNTPGFEAYLGRTLIAFDINKIEAILGYQNSLWKEKTLFASIVEHGVYRYVYNNSPFENSIRLGIIMQWVEKNRSFNVSGTGNGKAKVKANLEEGRRKKTIEVFHYWPYPKEKLTQLYDALLLNQKILANKSFSTLFKKHEYFPKNLTIWKAPQIHLMYLLYLIYKKDSQHNSIQLHDIAVRLFRNIDKDFTTKVLNTTFNQLQHYLKGIKNKKKSPGLQSIVEIFESLKLE